MDALGRAKHLGGVGLDVYQEEPCPILSELSALDNVILTPHSAGYYPGLGDAVRAEVVSSISAYLQGKDPLGTVV